mgnify:CR=1 FL=1
MISTWNIPGSEREELLVAFDEAEERIQVTLETDLVLQRLLLEIALVPTGWL